MNISKNFGDIEKFALRKDSSQFFTARKEFEK